MRNTLIVGGLVAAIAAPALGQPVPAETQTQTTTVVEKKDSGAGAGAVAGAATGAVVAGPVGAAVGAVAGAVVGHTVAPPKQVRTYVTTQTVAPVTYGQPIVVGHVIESPQVTWLDVPRYDRYRWAYIDGQRVVVDARTHAVVAVY